MDFKFRNGDKMPALGLSTWKSGPGVVQDVVREAIKIGYRHLDCATFYGNESEIGQAFANAFDTGDVKREDLWVTSKLWNNAHLKKNVRPALEKTLQDLQLVSNCVNQLNYFLFAYP